MPTLADIYSAADSFKRRLSDAASNPSGALSQMLGYANDRARNFNELSGQAANEFQQRGGGFANQGPAGQALDQAYAESLQPVGMTVWHGSPYKFNAFDASKIGSGEGAQAYGHGLYVAENPEVASSYKKTLQGQGATKPDWAYLTIGGKSLEDQTAKMSPSVVGHITKVLKETNGDVDAALKKFKTQSKGYENNPIVNDVLDVLYKGKGTKVDLNAIPGGNLYKIDLPDEHIEKMLDWDKPLSQQPKNVQEAFKKSNIADIWKSQYGHDIEKSKPQADMVYKAVSDELGGQQAASEYFKGLGLPGIKYFDQGSRGAGKGSRNFVVFPGNEHLLNITDINGKPIK